MVFKRRDTTQGRIRARRREKLFCKVCVPVLSEHGKLISLPPRSMCLFLNAYSRLHFMHAQMTTWCYRTDMGKTWFNGITDKACQRTHLTRPTESR